MEKTINNYPDYNRATIKGLTIDNLILCDIYGSRNIRQSQEDGSSFEVEMPLVDENVSVENGKFFTLTDAEIEELKHPKMQDNN